MTILEHEKNEKRSKEQRKIKKEQRKKEKGARGEKVKGAGSKRLISERSREQGPPLTEALK